MSLPTELYTIGRRNAHEMPPRIPQPNHRHATPSGPWPFLDLDNEIDFVGPSAPPTLHPQPWSSVRTTSSRSPRTECLISPQYPASLFPNWTSAQQKKSGISRVVDHVSSHQQCTIHHVNVLADGSIAADADELVTEQTKAAYWETLTKKPILDNVRLRALFLDNLTGPVLQMLGTKYNIEPFFFSSSLNWIPSRYQEGVGLGSGASNGDHITITLTFIRSMQNPTTVPPSLPSGYSYNNTVRTLESADQVIDTQAPLALSSSDHILLPDILALHLIRHPDPAQSMLLSYHPPHTHRTTSAGVLRSRLLAAGRSVYWNKIFASTIATDPTFVLLALLWYPLYAFDEALETLYVHICWLESRVMATTDMTLTRQLHVVRAHLLHYASLLEDFRKCVVFVANTPNPVLGAHAGSSGGATPSTTFAPGSVATSVPTPPSAVGPATPSFDDQRDANPSTSDPDTIAFVTDLMRRESTNLLAEIARLEQSRRMQDSRLKNVMNLAFSSVNLEDSRTMQELTQAAVRDSAAMKQISYLTMFFLPASFVAALFGMNVQEITPQTHGTLPHYVAFALPLTALTIWIIMAFQPRRQRVRKDRDGGEHEDEHNAEPRFAWPLEGARRWKRRCRKKLGQLRGRKAVG
ncbi:hypothetical protein C8J57DRAFT_1726174 [Mycena rebaudengoi]|nr:hypothetical protein C8J57DRAFT_1726174 [Mycena rebaudengoi]